jgi:hypothetical protein
LAGKTASALTARSAIKAHRIELLQLRDLVNQRYTAKLVPFIGNPGSLTSAAALSLGYEGTCFIYLHSRRAEPGWPSTNLLATTPEGAVKKRSHTKTTTGGASGWTKRNKRFGEFFAVKKTCQESKRPQQISRAFGSRQGQRIALSSALH